MGFLQRFDFVVGTRFHGAMLALQAGVPAAVIAHDSRTYEMCTTMGVPVRSAEDVEGPLTAERLPELFPFDADAFLDKRRALHAAYAQILLDAQIDTVDPLKQMF
jgi:Polysaccharide pyruvyl transferase